MTQAHSLQTLTRRGLLGGTAGALALTVTAPVLRAAAPLNIVATTGMIADTAQRIGGDLVAVRGLMGPGVDPHGYRQTRSDIVAMTRADAVLWHGLYLEAQMESFLADLSRKVPVFAVAEAVPAEKLLSHADYDGRYDPHVWMDPQLWQDVTREITRALSSLQPENADVFARNEAEFLGELDALSVYAVTHLSAVPQEKRVLITAHDAFGYFGAAYGFEVVGIQGISTDSEAGLNRISELVSFLVTRGIGAVFVETSVSDRNIRALIEGAAAQGHDVTIAGALFSDAMGQEGTYEGTYPGMIDHNVTTIAAALGAEVPLRGRLGKLAAGS